jgi:hypothetical protein
LAQDFYFINADTASHAIEFELKFESAVRFFVSFIAPWELELELKASQPGRFVFITFENV